MVLNFELWFLAFRFKFLVCLRRDTIYQIPKKYGKWERIDFRAKKV